MIFQYRSGRSFFHRADPVSKLLWLVCVSALCLSFGTAAMQGILFAVVLLLGFQAAQLTPRELWRGIRLPFWFGVPYFVLQLLFLPGETQWFAVGPVAITAEALDFAAAVSLRLLTLVLASLLFVATTDPRDVVLSLAQQLRVPYRFAFGVSIALRFLPILEAEAAIIRSAQRMREHAGVQARRSWRQRLAEQQRYALAIFSAAVRRVQHLAEAMESRAFGMHRERTYRRRLSVSPPGKALAAASIAMSIAWLLLYFIV